MDTILVATDLTATSDEAVAYTRDLAERLRSRVVILHVMDVPWIAQRRNPLMTADGVPSDDLASLGDRAAGRLEEHVTEFRRAGIEAEGRVCQGDPHQMIELVADEVRAELIVTGTHSYHGLRKLVLGSVADRLLRIAWCPVIVVPTGGYTDETGRPKRPDPVTCALVATDFSPGSRPAIETAKELTAALRARVICYHTWPHPEHYVTADFAPSLSLSDEDIERVERDLKEQISDLCTEMEKNGVRAKPVLDRRSPEEGILDTSLREHADLIVVGTHGRRGLSRALLGSVATHIVADAEVPVMVVPMKEVAP